LRRRNSVFIAVILIALDILFSRFLSVYTPGNVDRFSLQFIPNAFSGFLFGPIIGALLLVAGEILGAFIDSPGLAADPLFALSAAIKGLIYGWMFHNKEITTKRIFLSFLLVTALVDIGLSSVWLIVGRRLMWQSVLFPILLTKSAFVIVQTVLFSMIARPLSNRLR